MNQRYIVRNESIDQNNRRRYRLEREGDPTSFMECLVPSDEDSSFRVGDTVTVAVEKVDG